MNQNDIIWKALKYVPNRLFITRLAVRSRPGDPYKSKPVAIFRYGIFMRSAFQIDAPVFLTNWMVIRTKPPFEFGDYHLWVVNKKLLV